MKCRICGSEVGVKYSYSKRQALCSLCAADTPKKISRDQFDKRYWGKDCHQVPNSTRREFYSDYLSFNGSFAKYVSETTSKV